MILCLVPLATVILGRDILLSISAFYYRWISLPPPVRATFPEVGPKLIGGPAAENIRSILGLLYPFGGGSTNPNQQI